MSFYVLKNPGVDQGSSATDFVQADPVNDGEAPRCSVCGSYTGMIPWLPPHRAELETWGTEYGDVAFGPGDELLVSERFADLFKGLSLTGLQSFNEVEITKVKNHGGSRPKSAVPKYFCVLVKDGTGAIDQKASGLVLREPWTCEKCRSGFIIRTARVVLEENTWSGEDVFYARGLPGTIITSQRFADFCAEYSIRNAVLVPAEKFSLDFYPGKTDGF